MHLWNPPFCGDLDMRIARDGTWFYQGTPIGRPALVRLFSTILKYEDGKHFLVTPVEKVGIRVDDVPFLAVEMTTERDERGRRLSFRTNVEDWVPCDADHRLRFEAAPDGGLTPYLHVRANLWAKVTRALYYDLVDMGEERMVDGRANVRGRIVGRILCDGGCGAGEGSALTEADVESRCAFASHQFGWSFSIAREPGCVSMFQPA